MNASAMAASQPFAEADVGSGQCEKPQTEGKEENVEHGTPRGFLDR
jgi:hypothetical protein